jgi:hypothetical protein
MELSPEEFRDLARSLEHVSEPIPDNERRRTSRKEVRTRIPLCLIDKGIASSPKPIQVRDLSPRGINILYPEVMPSGQQFTIDLKGSANHVTLLCTALHCHTAESGLHSVGAEFTCVVPSHGMSNPSRRAEDEGILSRIRESMLG